MSEHQYEEVEVADRPLGERQMSDLRALDSSSAPPITARNQTAHAVQQRLRTGCPWSFLPARVLM
ncbi:MAG: hypothetical protein HY527_01730 [Betaproteobacteria bacterium]|nr:hypothetical protein [Betaproteobacteria bacterium]